MLAGPAIGIDLGTAFSSVGVFQDGNVEIIANGQGDRKTPSFVAFTDREYLTGVAAKNQAEMHPTNTVYDVKRLIGRRFNDEAVQSDLIHWPFKVVNSNTKPKVEVKYCGKTKQFTAEEISSMVLLEMKETAEAYTGKKITDAVITVPAYFNSNQRQATIDAGKIAGLNVMRIISEPMAAALAYGLGKRVDRQRNLLIFDLGGGTFDVSVMSIENKKFEVIAVGGDTHLGGGDFDSRLVDYCVDLFKQEHEGIDLTVNAKAISRLRKACENAKRTLSLLERTSIDVESLHEGVDFSVSISRRRFEQLCSDLFDRMLAIVYRTLSDARLDKADVHEILLVGGSTRVLKVQHILQNFFSGSKFVRSINPDEAAACGAALLASGMIDEQALVMLEVAPLLVNLAMPSGAQTTLIERNMEIPLRTTLVCTAHFENQQYMLFRVYEGEQLVANASNMVGEFMVSGFPPSSHRIPQIEIIFAVDENGILNVSAVDVSSGQQVDVDDRYNSRLSEEQIEQMMNEAEESKLKNEKQRSKMAARNELESYIFTMQSELVDDEIRQRTSEEQCNRALKMCETALKWIELDEEATGKDYELMHKKVERACSPIMAAKQHS